MRLTPQTRHREPVFILQPPVPADMRHRHLVRRRKNGEPEILPPGRVLTHASTAAESGTSMQLEQSPEQSWQCPASEPVDQLSSSTPQP
ncbi:hypothetical protein ABIB49_002476 [Arthrobacter sp. UYCu512]